MMRYLPAWLVAPVSCALAGVGLGWLIHKIEPTI